MYYYIFSMTLTFTKCIYKIGSYTTPFFSVANLPPFPFIHSRTIPIYCLVLCICLSLIPPGGKSDCMHYYFLFALNLLT